MSPGWWESYALTLPVWSYIRIVKKWKCFKNGKKDLRRYFTGDDQNSSVISVTEARRIRENVRKQANYLSHRRIDLDDFSLRVEKQLSDLKSRIKMARNAAESIKISITNQRQGHPDSNPMGCSRSYRVNLTSSTTNEIRCKFRKSLVMLRLFYKAKLFLHFKIFVKWSSFLV